MHVEFEYIASHRFHPGLKQVANLDAAVFLNQPVVLEQV